MLPAPDPSAHLVLDSTEFVSDWMLSGMILRQAVRIPNLRVVIPSPVLLETVANHGRAWKMCIGLC